jgi:hypothetical protein
MAVPPIPKPKGQGQPSPKVQPRQPRGRTDMTQNEITGLMRDAGFDNLPEADYWYPSFKHFANLVAQHEREACAKVCDDIRHYNLSQETDDWIEGTKDCANAIRERGEHDAD